MASTIRVPAPCMLAHKLADLVSRICIWKII
jgi:hypothetical protein